ncbi:hypothetical protein JRQ81_013532 [Phrynocephalus forsythii]|uniref:LINE-1 type transposase domain-containing 1 n=1 Tax=Phrynocephalus forsythii TaxID=171643 RepID=A0A9Q0Y1A7_9SAUR|nr:hypothetical protein JRQ81_013532 [Phrynocephalus forsythii]
MLSSESGTDINILETLREMAEELKSLQPIKDSVDCLREAVKKIAVRVGEAEARISELEDTTAAQNTTISALQKSNAELTLKIDQLEGNSRRSNLRILGILVNSFLRTVLELPEDYQLQIERAHRITCSQGSQRPPPFLVKFLSFSVKEFLLRRAREKKDLFWGQGQHRILIFPDYTKSVVQQRKAFATARKLAREKHIEYVVKFPAIFCIRSGSKLLQFHSPEEVEKYVFLSG